MLTIEENKEIFKFWVTQLPFFFKESFYDEDLKINVTTEVAHRRAGKSVGLAVKSLSLFSLWCKETKIYKVRKEISSRNPVIAFIAPTKTQARDIIWKYLIEFLSGFPGVHFNSQTLVVTCPRPHTGDTCELKLYASKQHDRMRGIKLRVGMLDEFQDAPPDCITSSIGPALSDTRGQLYVTGTAKGMANHLYTHVKKYIDIGAPVYIFPANKTGLLTPQELMEEKQKSTSDYLFRQEYMCDFTAPVVGSFYHEKITLLEKEPDFYTAKFDPRRTLFLVVDIGIAKGFCGWVVQITDENTINVLEYYEDYIAINDLRLDLQADGFIPDIVIVPHDASKRLNAKYVIRTTLDLFIEVFRTSMIKKVARPASKMTAIANVMDNLHLLRFPRDQTCTDIPLGMRKLKNFSRKKVKDTLVYSDEIDKSTGDDHAADALQTLFDYIRIRHGTIVTDNKYKSNNSHRQSSMLYMNNWNDGNIIKNGMCKRFGGFNAH